MELLSLLLLLLSVSSQQTDNESSASTPVEADTVYARKEQSSTQRGVKPTPPEVHNPIGATSAGSGDGVRLKIVNKRQQHDWSDRKTLDSNIHSPKSATFSHDGNKLYVNSLEGCKTAIYSIPEMTLKSTINYTFPSGSGGKWAPPSGYYNFTHYPQGREYKFSGKPVESVLSHNGKYLWVTFYRRTFDINAQDPSALALIDADADTIVRMFETGPLPKMLAVSPDNKRLAVTHWGDNTIGMIDISDGDLNKWHHLPPVTIGSKVKLDYSLTEPVNRDEKSGNLLRGSIFTPDSRYLLVSGMAGPLNIIDTKKNKLIASVSNLYGIRHLAIANGYLYGSKNIAGEVVKLPLQPLIDKAIKATKDGIKHITADGVISCKVGRGARTLALSPKGKYIFVACNSASCLSVINEKSMQVKDTISIDSYPVGLAVCPTKPYIAVTSQGRNHKGGNSVNLLYVELTNNNDEWGQLPTESALVATGDGDLHRKDDAKPLYQKLDWKEFFTNYWVIGIIVIVLAAIALFLINII